MCNHLWVVPQIRIHLRVLVIRVPFYSGDLKKDPNSENYSFIARHLERWTQTGTFKHVMSLSVVYIRSPFMPTKECATPARNQLNLEKPSCPQTAFPKLHTPGSKFRKYPMP